MSPQLNFFGISTPGASIETVQKGRRRVAAYFCALSICLMVASASYEEWIYGGVEISSNQALPPRVILSDDFTWVERSVDATPAHARQLQATPTPLPGARWFTLGLTRAYFEQPYTFPNSNEASTQVREYDVLAFVRDINAGSQNVNSFFYGLKIIPTSIFPATQGLLAFAAFLQVVLWILLMLLSYDLPSLVNFKWSPLIIRLLAVSTAFFTFVAVLVFMTSNLKTEFCSIFDPDNGTNFNGLPCVWGIAAGCAVSALVFQIINVIILWFGMSSDLGVSFSFKSSGGGADALAPLGGASFQGSFQAGGEGTAPAPSSAGGYSGFGSSEL